jgi:hypothetical protein
VHEVGWSRLLVRDTCGSSGVGLGGVPYGTVAAWPVLPTANDEHDHDRNYHDNGDKREDLYPAGSARAR